MNNRREEKTHLEKGIPIYTIISAFLAVGIAIAGLTNWADSEHAATNKQVAINTAVIASEKEAKERDRKVQMRFYTSIEREVTDIKQLMIKRDDKINDFMIKVLEK